MNNIKEIIKKRIFAFKILMYSIMAIHMFAGFAAILGTMVSFKQNKSEYMAISAILAVINAYFFNSRLNDLHKAKLLEDALNVEDI